MSTKTWSSAGTFSWVVPDRVTSVTLCMIAAGGGGAENYSDARYGGGYNGDMYQDKVYTTTPGSTITVVVGKGGAAGTTGSVANNKGKYGGDSKFGTLTRDGGKGGGITQGSYKGTGGTRPSNCMGTFKDGTSPGNNFWGGQGGFANGGNAGDNTKARKPGSRGSGGGGGDTRGGGNGKGGDGYIKITYTQDPIPFEPIYVGTEQIREVRIGATKMKEFKIG